MIQPADSDLLQLAESLWRMGDLPLDKIHAPCTECTPDAQCWHHKQFHPEIT